MRQDLISVIIPAFNAAIYLDRCLESVFSQTHKNREVIVINDGSTDATADILRKYADRITFTSQENRGPSAARNHGLSLLKGNFVAFLDADDYWLPDFLSRCLNFFEQYPKAEAVSTGQKFITWKGKATINPSLLRDGSEKQEAGLLSDFFRFWAEQDHIRTGSCVLRKNLVNRAGPMREDLRAAEDWEYWGYLSTFGTWGFIPEALWVGNSASSAAAQRGLEKIFQRSKMVPTVEDWQKRIIPRLGSGDWDGFRLVRGRVAQALAFGKLLGGDIQGARQIALRYGPDFPVNPVSRLLRWLAPKGLTAWKALSLALLLREMGKDWRLRKAHYPGLSCKNW